MNKKGGLGAAFIFLVIIIAIVAATYFITVDELIKTISLVVFVVMAIFSIILLAFEMTNSTNRLRRGLRKISPLLAQESAADLRKHYSHVYELYLSLSEKMKRNFYPQIMRLREILEEGFHLEKKVETMIENFVRGSIRQEKRAYEELYGYFRRLPRKVQERHYPSLVHIKDRLERGR